MTDAEAEFLLMALASQLNWRIFLQYCLRALHRVGEYNIWLSRGKYSCHFTSNDEVWPEEWGHRTPDLAIAKRACDWHVAKGTWPTFWEEGWEFAKA